MDNLPLILSFLAGAGTTALVTAGYVLLMDRRRRTRRPRRH